MNKKNVNIPAGSKPFGAMDEASFQQLADLIEGQYIFVFGTERTIRGTIKELKKIHGLDNPILSRFKFLITPFMADNDFIITKKEEGQKKFESLLEQYKNKEGAWIEIT